MAAVAAVAAVAAAAGMKSLARPMAAVPMAAIPPEPAANRIRNSIRPIHSHFFLPLPFMSLIIDIGLLLLPFFPFLFDKIYLSLYLSLFGHSVDE